jgi:hypothetical protein
LGRKSRNRLLRQPASPSRREETVVASDMDRESRLRSRQPGLATAAAAGVLLLVLATVWATPRASGDTFMALAGGRDVFEGKLGKPDEWSFTTSGKVWPHQNWGFDALAYGAFRFAGEPGLLALKALLILAIAAAIVAAARARGAPWPATLLVTAAVLAGARWRFDLRANLATLLLGPLVVLIIYRSRVRASLIWIAVPLIAVWANVHGGFMLGFALLGLWLAATALSALRAGGPQNALQRSWAPAGALAASLVLAAGASPFGIENLTHPFTIANSPEWRTITEWQPTSLTAMKGAVTVWELLLLLALILAVAAWRLYASRHARKARAATATIPTSLTLFDASLVLLMTAMAFSANRFVPLALMVLAPLAAELGDDLLRSDRRWVPTALCALALAIPLVPFAAWAEARYAKDNPRFTDESVFQRMVGADRMPYGAANFLDDNGLVGRAFNEWRWEGFLHLRCPQLKLFLGGRAQQIYSIDALHAYREVTSSPQPADVLARWGVHIVVVPAESEYIKLVNKLVFAAGAHWATVFYDDRALVLSDLSARATRALAEDVAASRPRFRRNDVAALSRALCRVSPALGVGGPQAVEELLAANQTLPTAGGPWFVLFAAAAGEIQPQLLARLLENEDRLLAAESGSTGRLARLQARVSIAQILENLYRAAGRTPQASKWGATFVELLTQVQTLLADS